MTNSELGSKSPEISKTTLELARDLRRFARSSTSPLESDEDLYHFLHDESTVVNDLEAVLRDPAVPMTFGRNLANHGDYFSAGLSEVYEPLDLSGTNVVAVVGEPPMRFLGNAITIDRQHNVLSGTFGYSWRLSLPLFGEKIPSVKGTDLDYGARTILEHRYNSGVYPDDRDTAYRMFAAWLTQAAAAEVAELLDPNKF